MPADAPAPQPVAPEVRAALCDLTARYALAVDRRELDTVVALFTEDGVLVLPDPPASLAPVTAHEGRAAIRAAMSAVAAVPQTFHAVVGEVHDAGGDDDTATGTVACEAHHLSRGRSGEVTDLVWQLRYADTYRRTPQGWRFARRELHVATVALRPVRAWLGDRVT
ncbi:nuclear transport factor 2 family protein [Blastococcus sp. SYSU D00820]